MLLVDGLPLKEEAELIGLNVHFMDLVKKGRHHLKFMIKLVLIIVLVVKNQEMQFIL